MQSMLKSSNRCWAANEQESERTVTKVDTPEEEQKSYF